MKNLTHTCHHRVGELINENPDLTYPEILAMVFRPEFTTFSNEEFLQALEKRDDGKAIRKLINANGNSEEEG